MTEQSAGAAHGDKGHIPIVIDDVNFDAPSHEMTGQALRNLPTPPVPSDRDLWLTVPGPHDDLLIRPELTYEVKSGSHYYTAPSTINPGAAPYGSA
jgi:hypothetical protein